MALVKYNPKSKMETSRVSTSDDVKTTNSTVPCEFSTSNHFPQLYCKRVIVQKSNGDEPSVTRIEEAVFRYNQPTSIPLNQFRGQPYEQLFQSDNHINQSENRHRRKGSHASRHKSHKSSKKDGKNFNSNKTQIKFLYIKIAMSVILGCLLLAWWFPALYGCQAKPLDFLGLESSLKNTVIGQEYPISSLLLNFYRSSHLHTQPPVFLFCGSTGVGKSFTISQIIDNFPGSGHKEILFYPSPAPEVVVKKLRSCEHNLLVLDGLHFKDSHDVASWAKRIQEEAARYRKNVWIILAFTTEHWTSDTAFISNTEFLQEISKFSSKIEEVFNRLGVDTKLITFQPMEVHNVKECVQRELKNVGLLADETQLSQIVQQLTSTPSHRIKGCKHVKKYFLHSTNTIGLLNSTN